MECCLVTERPPTVLGGRSVSEQCPRLYCSLTHFVVSEEPCLTP